MAEFYEIVHARLRDGIEQEVVNSRPALEAEVREALPGLLDIMLVRLDDGTYLDVLRWESREAADAGAERFGEIPAAGEIHGHFEDEDLGHYRGEVAVAEVR
jgi:heme-degrading monooxygenase HmoA